MGNFAKILNTPVPVIFNLQNEDQNNMFLSSLETEKIIEDISYKFQTQFRLQNRKLYYINYDGKNEDL